MHYIDMDYSGHACSSSVRNYMYGYFYGMIEVHENLKRHINNNNNSVDAIKCSNLPGMFLTTYGTGKLLCFAGTNCGLG